MRRRRMADRPKDLDAADFQKFGCIRARCAAARMQPKLGMGRFGVSPAFPARSDPFLALPHNFNPPSPPSGPGGQRLQRAERLPQAPICPHSSQDGSGSEQRLATACLDGKVRIFDAANGRELLTIQAHGDKTVNCVAVSPNGEQILSGSYDKVRPPAQAFWQHSKTFCLLSVLSLGLNRMPGALAYRRRGYFLWETAKRCSA